MIRTNKLVVPGEELAAQLAAALVLASVSFGFMPLPDNRFEFEVKAEAVATVMGRLKMLEVTA